MPLPAMQLAPGGVLFFRESCFRPSGDRPRNGNPTHYRSAACLWFRCNPEISHTVQQDNTLGTVVTAPAAATSTMFQRGSSSGSPVPQCEDSCMSTAACENSSSYSMCGCAAACWAAEPVLHAECSVCLVCEWRMCTLTERQAMHCCSHVSIH